MAWPSPWLPGRRSEKRTAREITPTLPVVSRLLRTGTVGQISIVNTLETSAIPGTETIGMETPQKSNIAEDKSIDSQTLDEATDKIPLVKHIQQTTKPLLDDEALGKEPESLPPETEPSFRRTPLMKRGTALLLIALVSGIVLHALTPGSAFFLGSQGWASVLNGPAYSGNSNLLKSIGARLKQTPPKGKKASTKTQITPQQYIDLIVNKMTLDQKLGQMMIVQFTGSTYSLPISTMISQYNVGAVLVFPANGNIISKGQLTSLIKQMKDGSAPIPLTVAIDQEGGTVDRLINLDGPRPAEATIGASNNPAVAKQAGMHDAQDLASYGFNLNLAPVVDVTNTYNAQLYDRTYGNTPALVTKMAAAYLQGLQKSGKVVGTLKHFPGLGSVSTDPHIGIPYLNRSKSDLERIDWAPYRALIRQGNVHAIMVTHEIVAALDKSEPSSLSPKVISGILRKELGFQGVIMTDSLTMDALTAYASQSQAAVLSVEAGADLLMGAGSPQDVASMLQGLKQAINSGALTEQRINESVRRILLMKYAMGLLPIPQN